MEDVHIQEDQTKAPVTVPKGAPATFYMDPYLVKVHADLPRFREEMGAVKDLAESILKFGQLQPVVINRNKELVAGGRRLAACMFANTPVLCTYRDANDPLLMRELELEENLQRKAFTPAEEALAVKEIHLLRMTAAGGPKRGKLGEGYSMEDTAKHLGTSNTRVSRLIGIAELVERFPALKEAKTLNEIESAGKALVRKEKREKAVLAVKENLTCSSRVRVFNSSAQELLLTLNTSSVDVLLTDPPYGIDINKSGRSIGSCKDFLNTSGFTFSDEDQEALSLYQMLAGESYRVCKPSAHAYVFVAPEFFNIIRHFFEKEGWIVSPRPIIWHKGSSGQCMHPAYWPSNTYEMILFARRVDSCIIKQGQPDNIFCKIVESTKRIHPTEKPIELLQDLIARVAMPGQICLDPFMGSASSLEAALREGLVAVGCDTNEDAYTSALYRLSKVLPTEEVTDDAQ